MEDEFNTLEEYANTVKECLTNITHEYQMAKDDDIQVLYATAPVAYAKEEEMFANGSKAGPLITFYQSGITIDKAQQMGAWFQMPVVRSTGNYIMRAPLIVQIKYTVTIHALTELEADMLQSQILMATTLTRPYYTKLNGQFVLIDGDNPTNVGSVEVGDNKDKVSKRQLDLTIERAYLSYNYRNISAGKIYYKNEGYVKKDGDTLLANGAILTSDMQIKNGYKVGNGSKTSDDFFNYQVVDPNGISLGTVPIGIIKTKIYTVDGASDED